YQGNKVADLDMAFLHDGRPTVVREARWGTAAPENPGQQKPLHPRIQSGEYLQLSGADLQARIEKELQENPFLERKSLSPQDALLAILSHYSVCSKEWVIR